MKRILALVAILGMCSLTLIPIISPVRPFIQLPGEVYPGTQYWPVIGDIFGGLTNTFMSAVVAWIVVLVLALAAKARSRTADEVPTGYYNFFEMVIEGAYNFAANIAGPKVKDFFPFFMTFILFILTANWMGLIPGWDSVGLWEYKPHFLAEGDINELEGDLRSAIADNEVDMFVAGLEEQFGFPIEIEDGHFSHETEEEILHALEVEYDETDKSDLRVGPFLLRADRNAITDSQDPGYDPEYLKEGEDKKVGFSKKAADWTIVPFFRPAATDLNFTLAFALVAMIMVQYYGFKYLGARGYLSKFFPFIGKGFGAEVSKNPIRVIDVFVGLLELVSEFSKIVSFAFRLLGNIFAGMVLLFVMAFLLPAANIAFYGLEFFVGMVQALVFGLLMLIFMFSATESHHGDEDHH